MGSVGGSRNVKPKFRPDRAGGELVLARASQTRPPHSEMPSLRLKHAVPSRGSHMDPAALRNHTSNPKRRGPLLLTRNAVGCASGKPLPQALTAANKPPPLSC